MVYIDGPHKILGKRAKLIIAPPFRLDPPISGLDSDYFVTRRMTDERRSNVYKWLGYDSEAMYRWHEHYNEATFQIAKMTGTPIIDITLSLDRCVGGKEQYYLLRRWDTSQCRRTQVHSIANNEEYLNSKIKY